MNKRLGAIAIVVAAVAPGAGLFASPSRSARRAQPVIGFIGPAAPYYENGARSAAAALGDQLAVTEPGPGETISAIKSLVAQHVAGIAVREELRIPETSVLSALAEARKAGIPTLSFEGRDPGSLWVSESSSTQFTHSLADALASQMKQRGKFVIVSCRAAKTSALSHVVGAWLKKTKTYFQRRYPRMRRVGIAYGPAHGTIELRSVLRQHPRLRGLDFLCPGDALFGPPQLIRAHKVGKVFSAGNGGGSCPPLGVSFSKGSYADSVRAGAMEIVCPRNPTKLGYLTVWAADHLARGGRLVPGAQRVGGPVGAVGYYRRNRELRLGLPLTITKANLDQYTNH
jgi:ABC-type sugar transport system substrate-binding protein